VHGGTVSTGRCEPRQANTNRTITVNGEYLRRFITQGVKADSAAAPAVVPPSPDTK